MNKNNDLLTALLKAASGYSDWDIVRQAAKKRQTIHVAVMAEPFLTYLLEGKKTIESRFSKPSIAPFKGIEAGDLVLLKRSGGPIVGRFTAGHVIFVHLDRYKLAELKKAYSEAICANDDFWHAQTHKNCATLIEVTDVQSLQPAPFAKKDRRGWLTCCLQG